MDGSDRQRFACSGQIYKGRSRKAGKDERRAEAAIRAGKAAEGKC